MPLNIEYMKSRSLGAATGGSVGVSIWIHSRLLQNSTHLLRDSAISSSEHSSAAAPSVTAHYWQSVPTATRHYVLTIARARLLRSISTHILRETLLNGPTC